MSEAKRVVLVKPGDILIFGNVGPIDPEDFGPATAKLREAIGIEQIFFFDGDIDMDLISAPTEADDATPKDPQGELA